MKKLAIFAAKKAGQRLLKEFKKLSLAKIKAKDKHDILTPADLESEKIILDLIQKKFPGHSILTEESSPKIKKSPFIWVIDPLDGTTNFAMKNPIWSIAISLWKNNKPLFGVVFAPAMNEFFVAETGKGACLNGQKIKVSKITKLQESLLTFCHGHCEQDIKRAIKLYQKFKLGGRDLRQLGSAAIEMGFVAAGRTESIMIPGANPWDVAAGTVLVREAGGRVTDFEGKDWNLKSKDMLASNGLIHNLLLKEIHKVK
jgi:myo-inositol-1(or 4)-monophosphatase